MIQLRGLSKTYDGESYALRDVDLSVERGEIFGIIGRSGAGKSTLVRCINLLERPSAGSVVVDGIEMTSLSAAGLRAARREVGMIFQHFNLLSSRTVFANVAMPLELAGISREEIEAIVTPLLAFVGLEAMRDRYPAQLSGGQAQRVGIARALANRPKVLLCDEATSALDPQTTQSILQLLREVNREFGVTIVLITHELGVIKSICDRVAFLEEGRVAESGAVRQLFLAPQSATTRAFIGGAAVHDIEEMLGTTLAPSPMGATGVIWRLGFGEESAREPVITNLIRGFPLELRIVSGSIERVGGAPLGLLVVEIVADAAVASDARAYLAGQSVHVEVMGYVDRASLAAP